MSAVILDDNTIHSMSRNSAFTEAFPFLRTAVRTIEAPCRCSRQRRVAQVPDYERIRQLIAGLPLEGKRKLKQLFGNQPIEFRFRREDGKIIKCRIE